MILLHNKRCMIKMVIYQSYHWKMEQFQRKECIGHLGSLLHVEDVTSLVLSFLSHWNRMNVRTVCRLWSNLGQYSVIVTLHDGYLQLPSKCSAWLMHKGNI